MRKPKDKASVENTVAHVATWVIAALRDEVFTSLPELAAAIEVRVAAYNTTPFLKRPGSRHSVFSSEEQPLLRPLPQVAYEISRGVYGRRVGRSGHVVWEKNHYSVPYPHIGSKVDLRITDRVLDVFAGSQRLSSHLLLPEGSAGHWRTTEADLPTGEKYQPWDSARVREWAGRVGPAAQTVIDRIFESAAMDSVVGRLGCRSLCQSAVSLRSGPASGVCGAQSSPGIGRSARNGGD